MELEKNRIYEIVKNALKEDIGPIDVTTAALIPKIAKIRADIVTREDGVACGLLVVEAVFDLLDKDVRFKPQARDGDPIYKDKVLCYIEGPARPVLTGERTALNFLQRLSGIASMTRKFADKCLAYGVKVMDTRKTSPGLRCLEKYAVAAGGGYNHRMGLWDQVLIKDNHLKIISGALRHKGEELDIERMLRDLRKRVQKNVKIEIEVEDLETFERSLGGRPDIIMLDNMSPADVKKAVDIRRKSGAMPFIEVSGNITLENIEEYAKARPDIISVGSLTHSVKALDMSLEIYG
jgi:nicotinate-nucleotide pyrophosphorylase (carboxylating)